jgi:hypothetical protein
MRTIVACLTLLTLLSCGRNARAQGGPSETVDPAGPELDVDTDLPLGPILVGSFGVVLVAVGAGFGWQADQEHEDWDAARKAGDPEGQMDGLSDDVRAHSIAANVLMFSGAGIAALSLIWLLVSGGDDDEPGGQGEVATALWRPELGPGRVGLSLQF